MKKLITALAIVTSILFYSCSGTSSAGQNFLNKKYGNNEYFKFVNFKKTDAVNGEEGGVNVCKLQGDVEVECIKDGGWIRTTNGYMEGLFASKIQHDPYDFMTPPNNTQTETGKHYKASIELYLTKHDNGWQVQDWHVFTGHL